MSRILVVGGYGNFGSVIARRLARESDFQVIVAGRSLEKARVLAQAVGAEACRCDIRDGLDGVLSAVRPDILVHTSGPFQGQGYEVAEACIRNKVHYIDLADCRAFVCGITRLDVEAREAGVLIVSGASTVPALTAALIDSYRDQFRELESVTYGIATAQRATPGLATLRGVLSYAGKPFSTLLDGRQSIVFGWQDLHWRKFHELGWRTLANCDVPDLELFPARYPGLKTQRFYAGLELPVVQLSLWLLTWLVRVGLISNVGDFAEMLNRLARPLDAFGSDRSGFFLEIVGADAAGKSRRVVFDLVARSGHGPMIPCVPAIVTALRLGRGQIAERGATPCIGLVDRDALLEELTPLDISWRETN